MEQQFAVIDTLDGNPKKQHIPSHLAVFDRAGQAGELLDYLGKQVISRQIFLRALLLMHADNPPQRNGDHVKPNEKAKSILDNINYIAVATASKDGQPWNTPVAASHFDGDYTLYWASWQDNQHSQNIRANGRAFAVVYDSTPAANQPSAGVYMQGRAYELTDEQEVMRAALVFKDDPYNPSDGKQYLGDYPRRIYKFVPEKIWMNDDSEVNGNFIDIRTEAGPHTSLAGDIKIHETTDV